MDGQTLDLSEKSAEELEREERMAIKTDFELISVQGGQKDNAITREATAEILVLEENVDAVREYAASVQGAWREEYAGTDEGITVTVEDEVKKK